LQKKYSARLPTTSFLYDDRKHQKGSTPMEAEEEKGRNPLASRHRVQCVTKSGNNLYDAHERLLFIGGINEDNSHWKTSQQAAIVGIEDGTYAFYVQEGGNHVEVVVAQSADGHKYLKTTADNEQPHTLLRLSSCP
jgi:hypothetical protein